jgi:hypothetical protein
MLQSTVADFSLLLQKNPPSALCNTTAEALGARQRRTSRQKLNDRPSETLQDHATDDILVGVSDVLRN